MKRVGPRCAVNSRRYATSHATNGTPCNARQTDRRRDRGYARESVCRLIESPRASGQRGTAAQVDAPGRHPIWMKEMRFALDLVWLDFDGRVIAVLENVPPCSADPCPLYEPSGSDRSVAVLELPANAAARHGLAVGASVTIRDIPVPR